MNLYAIFHIHPSISQSVQRSWIPKSLGWSPMLPKAFQFFLDSSNWFSIIHICSLVVLPSLFWNSCFIIVVWFDAMCFIAITFDIICFTIVCFAIDCFAMNYLPLFVSLSFTTLIYGSQMNGWMTLHGIESNHPPAMIWSTSFCLRVSKIKANEMANLYTMPVIAAKRDLFFAVSFDWFQTRFNFPPYNLSCSPLGQIHLKSMLMKYFLNYLLSNILRLWI